MPQDKQFVVTVSSDRPIAEVADELARSGFVLGETLAEIGVITGHGPEGLAGRLRAIRGVTDVSADAPIDVGPPSSPETW